MQREFILFSEMRSGSYHLVSLLDSAPDIVCYGEIYKQKTVEMAEEARAGLGLGARDTGRRDALGLALPSRLARLHPEAAAVGFKLLPGHVQADRPFLAEMLKDPGMSLVVLRRPALAIAVSLAQAQRTGAYTRDAAQPLEAPQVTMDAAHLADCLGMVGRFRSLVRGAVEVPGKPVFQIGYSQLGWPKVLGRLLDFLGSSASPLSLTSTRHRQSDAPLHRRVANWDWVVAHLKAKDQLWALKEAGYSPDGQPALKD